MAQWNEHKHSWRGIAVMGTEDSGELCQLLNAKLKRSELVIFPAHGHGGHVLGYNDNELPNCPAVTHEITGTRANPACIKCKKCLTA